MQAYNISKATAQSHPLNISFATLGHKFPRYRLNRWISFPQINQLLEYLCLISDFKLNLRLYVNEGNHIAYNLLQVKSVSDYVWHQLLIIIVILIQGGSRRELWSERPVCTRQSKNSGFSVPSGKTTGMLKTKEKLKRRATEKALFLCSDSGHWSRTRKRREKDTHNLVRQIGFVISTEGLPPFFSVKDPEAAETMSCDIA